MRKRSKSTVPPKGKVAKLGRPFPPSNLDAFVVCRQCGVRLQVIKWSHLRSHGLTTDEYRRTYQADFLTSPLLRWRNAIANLRQPGRTFSLPRTRLEIIRDIQAYARERQAPLTAYWLKKRDYSLLRQAVRLYGTWAAVLGAAGVKGALRERWSRQRILKRVRQRAESGLGLAYHLVNRREPRLLTAARTYFGSWSGAVEAAGYEYQAFRARQRTPPAAQVELALRAWVAQHGPLSYTALNNRSPVLFRMVRRVFGTTRRAAQALGLPYRRPKPIAGWTRDGAIEALVRMIEAGKALTPGSVRARDPDLYWAIQRYFVAFQYAMEAAKRIAVSRLQRAEGARALQRGKDSDQFREETTETCS